MNGQYRPGHEATTAPAPLQSARRAARVAAALLLTTLLGGCLGKPATVVAVYGAPESQELWVSVSICTEEPSISVAESASEVRLTVQARESRWGNDCRGGGVLMLDAPLGTRTVIDTATNGELEVLPPED